MSVLPDEGPCTEVENFGVLDDLFTTDGSTAAPEPPTVALFTGGDIAALYRDGVLVETGEVSDLAIQASVLLGAHVYTGAEHLLGSLDGTPASDLATIEERAGALDRAADLREQAAALRAQAAALEDEATA